MVHDNEDTETELGDNTVIDTKEVKNKTNKRITFDITEWQEEDEVIDDEISFSTGTVEMNTNETVVPTTT